MGYPDYQTPIVFVLQDGELWPITEWVTRQGVEKWWEIETALASGASDTTTIYTVPANKVLYVVRVIIGTDEARFFRLYYTSPTVSIFRVTNLRQTPFPIALSPPIGLAASKSLFLYEINRDTISGTAYTTIQGYELDVP